MNAHASILDGFTDHLRKTTESGYAIKKSVFLSNDTGIALGGSKSIVAPFATWQIKFDENGGLVYCGAHYFSNKDNAADNLNSRVEIYKADNKVMEIKHCCDKCGKNVKDRFTKTDGRIICNRCPA
jgi:hypothetical protein